jgi:uncharacterized protein involved in exopolysaccharide biosynthesis
MTEQVSQQQQLADDEIDLRELFRAIWQGKWIIIATTFVFAVVAVFYAINLPNIYKSEALLSKVTEESGLRIPGQLGGLAALAGVNLGSGGSDKTGLALEILKSREFIGRFIDKHNLLIPVMAAKGWNSTENILIIDPELYDVSNGIWVRDSKAPFKSKPSSLEAHEKFLKLLSVSQDKASGMVRISVQHYSPFFAQQWTSLLVQEINDEMRSRELSEAQKSIDYLTSQINQTNIADVRTMLFSLIEEQTKTVMLANVRDEYVFKTIDPAVVAERKAKPKRSLIVLSTILLGFLLSLLIVFVNRAFFSKQ